MGLISSLFNVASSRDVPLRQPVHTMLACFVLLCVPVLFVDQTQGTVYTWMCPQWSVQTTTQMK